MRNSSKKGRLPKICLLSSCPPQRCGVAYYTRDFAQELQKTINFEFYCWNENGIWQKLLAPFKRFGELKRIVQDFDLIHFQYELGIYYPFFLPLVALLTAGSQQKPRLVITLHESHRRRELKYLPLRWHQYLFLHIFDRIIVHNRIHYHSLPKVLRHRAQVIPQGIRVNKRKQVARQTQRGLLVMIGFINPWKGHDLAIRALPQILTEVPETHLVIVGQGYHQGYLHQLKGLVKQLGLTNHVSFREAFVTEEELGRWIRRATLVLCPYRYVTSSAVLARTIEQGGIAVLSALPEFVEYTHGKAVYVECDNVSSLAQKVSEILKDMAQRERLQQTFKKLADEYALNKIARQTKQLYLELFCKEERA